MKTLQGQWNVSFPLPTAKKGRKTIKIARNLFVSLEEKKRKKSVSRKKWGFFFFFQSRKAIFLLSCSEKEYALLASATHRALFGYAVKPKTESAFKAASSSISLSDYLCQAFNRPRRTHARTHAHTHTHTSGSTHIHTHAPNALQSCARAHAHTEHKTPVP